MIPHPIPDEGLPYNIQSFKKFINQLHQLYNVGSKIYIQNIINYLYSLIVSPIFLDSYKLLPTIKKSASTPRTV